MIRVVE